MHWAKTRSRARFNLASSGVAPFPLPELETDPHVMEINGDNSYGYRPLQEAIAAHAGVDPECVVETAGNAEAALRALDQGEFDLVLSDIVMAGSQNGLDLARVIRERRPGFPVILATGYSEAAAQAAGEFTVLRKPYDASDLNKALTVLDERERLSPGGRKVLEFPGPGRTSKVKRD